MDFTTIILETAITINGQERPVARITINRPKHMNAINMELLAELEQAVDQLAGRDIQAVIITGARHIPSKEEIATARQQGKEPRPRPAAFIAGADIKPMPEMSMDQARQFVELGQRVMQEIEDLPCPVIAAVDGFALGGGTELAMACDIIYASERSTFGQPEVNLGIIPGFGGTQRLTRLVGRNMAKELIYTGGHLPAAEALRIGLVNKVVPADELSTAVEELVLKILGNGPLAIKAAKQAINQGLEQPLPEANRIELDKFLQSFDTHDRIEGTSAFIEKRPAAFSGQ